VDDPTLVAHWGLDEMEGAVAENSVGDNDGVVVGHPAWQPQGGQVNGALEFDGASFILTSSGIDPSAAPLSVLAWVRGGGPGQVVVSQKAGESWLMADSADGGLRSELKSTTRNARALTSTAAITDGNWHRIGLVWDGTNRRLYVDSVLVAADTQDELKGSSESIILGYGQDQAPSSFWTGLIDDVRIYNRVVRP
jgi:hypothetical protein